MMLLAACGGPGAVEYVDGQCLIGGVAATLAQVEAQQATLTHHILARQPVLTAIAVAAVAIAGGSYVQRLIALLAARRASAQTFAERVRARMERHRAHPVRYFAILGGVLAVLIAAGAAYISLDSDKRQSERALATLQFCHLALRTADEQRALGEQRDNLASIQATATDIRALVDKLPPEEQHKAHEIVDQMTTALGQQRSLVTRYAVQADASAKASVKAVEQHQAEVARDLDQLGGELKQLDTHDGDVAAQLARHDARLDGLAKDVEALVARPMPVAPVCPPVTCSCLAPPAPPSPSPISAKPTPTSTLSEDRAPAVGLGSGSGSGSGSG